MFVPKPQESDQTAPRTKVYCENLLLSEIIIALYHFAQTEQAPESVACVYNNTSAIFDLRDAANKYIPYNDEDEVELEFRLEKVHLNARLGERQIFLRHTETRNVIDATEFDQHYGAGIAQKAINAFLTQKNNIGSPRGGLGNIVPPSPLRKSGLTTMFKSLSFSMQSGTMSPSSAGTITPGTATPFSTSTTTSRTASPTIDLNLASTIPQIDESPVGSASPIKKRSIVGMGMGMQKFFAKPKNDDV